jgi:ankyrin repeat protein
MYRYLLVFILFLSAIVSQSSDISNGNNNQSTNVLLDHMRTASLKDRAILMIKIPEKSFSKQADFNQRKYSWMTTIVFPNILKETDPVNSFIVNAIKYYTFQVDCLSRDKLLIAGKELEKQYTKNPGLLMWLGFAYMVTGEKEKAKLYLNRAVKIMSKQKKITASCKFLCGVFLLDAYKNPNKPTEKIATATISHLVKAMNNTEITSNESDLILRILYKNHGYYYLLSRFLKHADKLSKPDAWLLNCCRGYSEVNAAWEARGSGWADTVTPIGWQGFYKHLQLAEGYLTKAWKKRPERPEAPARMISVAMGATKKSRSQLDVLWFNRAVAAQVDYLYAYESLLWSRRPRWGGSYNQMLQIGEAALLSKLYDTSVPLIYFYTLADIASEMPFSNWRAPFRMPGVYSRLESVCRIMQSYPHTSDKIKQIKACQFWIRQFCGRYQLASQYLEKNKMPHHLKEIKIDRTYWDYKHVKLEQQLFTGAYGKQLINAEAFCISGQNKAGAESFAMILDKVNNAEQKKYLLRRIAKILIEDNETKSLNSDSGLHMAICKYNIPLVKQLLLYGADINDLDRRGRSVLHLALYRPKNAETIKDLCEMVDFLLNKGININIQDRMGGTPLICYISRNRKNNKYKADVLKFLISKGADINLANKRGLTPLHYAISYNELELAQILIEQGANVNAKTGKKQTPLHYYVQKRNKPKGLQLLLDHGAEVNVPSNTGWTPLHSALSKKKTKFAEILIAHGADINALTKGGLSPLLLAILWKQLIPAEQIIKADAQLDLQRKSSGWTALHYAVNKGYDKIAIQLLDKGAKYSITGKRNQTPFHLAAYKGNSKIVEILIRKGADVNKRGGNTLTPLDYAIHCSVPKLRLSTAKLLLENEADINKCDGSGWSPVYRCAKFNMPEVLKLLLGKGANVNIKDKQGRTALDTAKSKQITEILFANKAKYGKDLP